jgi:hypothetical protein
MAIYIYNCKRCKVGRRVEYPVKYRTGNFRVDSKGKQVPAGVWINAIGGGRPTVYGGDTEMGLCPNCKKMMSFEKLDAVQNPEHVCDGRCVNARRGDCECSCGGENHGKAWAA